MYTQTYSDGNYDNVWDSIFVTCELFRISAKDVAEYFSFTYTDDEDINITEYLKHVKKLPSDAKEIY
jgi:aminoglycoside 6-adenylyltransferase